MKKSDQKFGFSLSVRILKIKIISTELKINCTLLQSSGGLCNTR